MKIISGKYKGRNVIGYDIDGTRPTMDRVKESLFAMIQNHIKDSNCLDLFAGSGNLGLEALSEGANSCTFIDSNKIAIKTIKNNLANLQEKVDNVYLIDFRKFLRETPNKYDLIFIDPPYKTDYIKEALILIKKNDLLTKDGLVILESSSIDKFIYSEYYNMYKERKYGDKYILVLEKQNQHIGKY